MIRLLSLDELEGHDVYEIAYARSYPARFWSDTSLYLSDDEHGIAPLVPYLDKVFHPFGYYGEQKVTLAQWQELFRTYTNDPQRDPSTTTFFSAVDIWLQGNQDADYFWILGI